MAITYNQNGIALIQLVNYCHIDFANSLRMKIVSQSLAKHKQLIKKQTNDMKTKIFALFAAMMLLVGTTAMAQSDNTKTTETELKGDVNGDGIVDVADIAAVIAVMHEQGTVKQQYYWYVGQENPASMTSISPIVTDNSSPGWRLIGTSIPTYSPSNMMWEGSMNPIITGETKQYNYVALPNSTLKLRVSDGGVVDSWENVGTKEINGVIYYIYKSPNMSKGFQIDIF